MNLQIAIVESAPVKGNVQATLAQMEEYMILASEQGVQLIVFPELFVTGYLPAFWENPKPTPDDEQRWLSTWIQSAAKHKLWMVIGHPSYRAETKAHGRTRYGQNLSGEGQQFPLYNAASLISPDGLVGTYAKVHLFGQESGTFVPGDLFPVWETPWGPTAIQICFDLEFPESARVAALAGAKILICPSNNMHPFGNFHTTYAMARAMENGVFVIYSNRTGIEMDLDFCGGSGVAHPNGTWIPSKSDDSKLQLFDLPLADLHTLDPALNYFTHRRPVLYRPIAIE